MKQAYIKNKKEFDKIATEYGFVKKDIGEVYEKWHKQIGKVEIYIFNLSNEIHIWKKGMSITEGKKNMKNYIEDISHLIEWR